MGNYTRFSQDYKNGKVKVTFMNKDAENLINSYVPK